MAQKKCCVCGDDISSTPVKIDFPYTYRKRAYIDYGCFLWLEKRGLVLKVRDNKKMIEAMQNNFSPEPEDEENAPEEELPSIEDLPVGEPAEGVPA